MNECVASDLATRVAGHGRLKSSKRCEGRTRPSSASRWCGAMLMAPPSREPCVGPLQLIEAAVHGR